MHAEKLTVIVREILDGFGLELESLEVVGGASHTVLRVVVDGDGADGTGPSLDDIAEATKAVSIALDDEPATGNRPYTLEVSSRGVSRPLTEPKHWRRNHQRLVEVHRDGQQPVTGRIVASDDTTATLAVEVPRAKGAKGPRVTTTSVTVLFHEVTTARIQAELTKQRTTEESEG